MTVYVDDMKAPVGRMIMCHMIADTLQELHRMADIIGVKRKWFQDARSGPHYDISMSKRNLAVYHGARRITWRQCGLMCAVWRESGSMEKPETAEEMFRSLRAARILAEEFA